MTSLRLLAAILLLAPLSAAARQANQDETIYLEEVKKDFLERAKKGSLPGPPSDRWFMGLGSRDDFYFLRVGDEARSASGPPQFLNDYRR